MKAFKDALKSFNRKAARPIIKLRGECHMQVFAKEIEACKALEGKQGFIRRLVCGVSHHEISVACEPGIAITVKGGKEPKEAPKPQTALRDLLHLGRPSNIDHLLRHPGSFTGNVPHGFELRDGVLMTEDSDRMLSSPRQTMLGGTIHGNGIFAHGETAKRILTGMESDLSKDDVVTEDKSLQPLADSLRTGRYTPSFDGAEDQPCYDNRKTLLALKTIAEAVGCKDHFSFSLKYEKGFRLQDEDFFIDVTVPGGVGESKHHLSVTEMSASIRQLGRPSNHETVSPGLTAFATVLAHTLNDEGTHYKYSLVKFLYEKARLEHETAVLEKFKESLRNIATMLDYGDELQFEVTVQPILGLTGYRSKVEFVCDKPCLRMFEAIQPAIFQGEWIDFGEVARVEQKLINKKEEEKLAHEKELPLEQRLVGKFMDSSQVVPDDFVKDSAWVKDVPLSPSEKALNDAKWDVSGIVGSALQDSINGKYPTSAIIRAVPFVIHDNLLAFKHSPENGKLVEMSLPYEAAYMVFAKELLEEILNRPNFPYPVKAFIQHYHPATHSLGVVSAVLPILDTIAQKKGVMHVVSHELFEHPLLAQ